MTQYPAPEPTEPGEALALELPAGDGGDVEEPAREHGFLFESVRAPGENQENGAGDLGGLG